MQFDAQQRAKIEARYLELLQKFRSGIRLKFGDPDQVALVELLDEIGKADASYVKHVNAAKRLNKENIERKNRAIGSLEYILNANPTS